MSYNNSDLLIFKKELQTSGIYSIQSGINSLLAGS